MKLTEALNLIHRGQPREGEAFHCFLATGFNSLHLRTFLTAELCRLIPAQKVEVTEGLYGDLSGNLGRLARSETDCGVVVIEWSDLDPRLGIRSAARWGRNDLADVTATARARAIELQRAMGEAAGPAPIAVCLPTLPLPPFGFTPGWQASTFELDLRSVVQTLTSAVAQLPQVRVVSAQHLDLEAPLGERADAGAECLSGFPYKLAYAAQLAASLARLTQKPAYKKGLITDLDGTLWKGILGEDGVRGVSWDMDHNSQTHAYYQRFLGVLASEGVLIGVASKNDPAFVEEALLREDLAVAPGALFPVEANWKPKSESVARILERWNIGADAVVFVDDSPLELAEVKAAYPDVECICYPTRDTAGVHALIFRLRDLFGKSVLLEEDALRVDSLRNASVAQVASQAFSTAAFLKDVEAEVAFNFTNSLADPRALELINKTNQFNLNGQRFTESAWRRFLSDPGSFAMMASYRDKFGPLGKIAVVAGSVEGKRLHIESWVMSCRAFSRRIEYKCLAALLSRFRPDDVVFNYQKTEKNGPLRDFLEELAGTAPSPQMVVTSDALDAHRNPIHT